jgi:GxxExxY protein
MLKHFELTDHILKAFYRVYNVLGYGFNEKVYENSLAIQLRDDGLGVIQQAQISVFYNDVVVGEYFADLLVNDLVIVELKAVSTLSE